MALQQILSQRKDIMRFGFSSVPMDEALAVVSCDLSGRSFFLLKILPDSLEKCEGSAYDLNYTQQFFRALCTQAGLTLHIDVLRETMRIIL